MLLIGAEPHLPGVLTLRTLDDAAALAEKLSQPGAHLLIVGGGFIGLEVAASARARDVRVTVVEGAPRLLGRAVPASVAARVHALHQAREAYTDLPWFWSDQYDHQLQVAGELALGAICVTRRPVAMPDAEIHFYLDAAGRLVGASGFGPAGAIAKDLKLARMLVQRGAWPDPVRLKDASVGLKALF